MRAMLFSSYPSVNSLAGFLCALRGRVVTYPFVVFGKTSPTWMMPDRACCEECQFGWCEVWTDKPLGASQTQFGSDKVLLILPV